MFPYLRFLRIAVWLLGFEIIGILSPVILLPAQLFTGPFHAPNLIGQYVLKDVILAAAGTVIAATLRGGRLVTVREFTRAALDMSRQHRARISSSGARERERQATRPD